MILAFNKIYMGRYFHQHLQFLPFSAQSYKNTAKICLLEAKIIPTKDETASRRNERPLVDNEINYNKMQKQLSIKLKLPQTISQRDDVKLQLIGYRCNQAKQQGQCKQGRNMYDSSNIGSVVHVIGQDSKMVHKLYESKDWSNILRQLPAFAFQVELIVCIQSIKEPSIIVKSLQNKARSNLFTVVSFDCNSLPNEKELTQLINKKAEEIVSKVSQKQFQPLDQLISLAPQKIFNPHLFIKTHQKQKYIEYYTKGIYEYYHYSDQSFNDHGWGCAYRSLQTLLSWFHLQGHCKLPKMPTLTDIQEIIDFINIASDQRIKNTREWIGATEVSWVIKKKTNYDCRILHIADGKDIIEHCQMFREHFEKVGCPIMYGGGQYAYSIVGINYSWQLGQCEFLILDPHYPGADSLDKILEKKGLVWRKPTDMFKKGIFYNFCLPLVPAKE